MRATWLLGAMGMVVATSLAACSAIQEENVGGDIARVEEGAFDKDSVLTDKELRDTTAMTVTDIQDFLEKTPWGNTSVLATYEENGKSAAEIMFEAAEKYGINPLEMVVRVQMEQSLISKKTASDESISLAFGCGCPHSPVCSPRYEGFTNQANCAAGTLSRSMDRATTTKGTASGWRKGEPKLTQDEVEVTPANAATAALYTYTPWVGQAGGGKRGVGGASLHYTVWESFADAIGYGVVSNAPNDTPRGSSSDVPVPGRKPNTGGNNESQEGEEEEVGTTPEPEEVGTTPEPEEADAGSPHRDAGSDSVEDAPSKKGDPAGTDSEGSANENEDDGEDDEAILGEGNAPPATEAPPPRSSGSRSRGSSRAKGGDDDDLPEATEEELAAKKKSSGGCSTTGGNASDASLVGLAMAAASIIAQRRRRTA